MFWTSHECNSLFFKQYHNFIVDWFWFFIGEHTNIPNKYLMDVISYFQCFLQRLHKHQQHNKQEINLTQKTQKE